MEQTKPSEEVVAVEPVATEPPARKQPRKRKPAPAPVPLQPAPAELADDDESESEPERRPIITTGRNKKKAKTTTVTKKTESQQSDWMTGVIRTTALIALGGASFYFQNIYGKKAVAEEVKKPVTVTPPPQPTLPSTNYFTQPAKKAVIGASGFNQ